MTITISGSGTITGLSAGGLPSATITQTTLATPVAGTGPAFSYYQSVAQTLSSNTVTKITFTSSEFDTTGGMYASSRFTPTVAGYYQVNAQVTVTSTLTNVQTYIYKNGSVYKSGGNPNSAASGSVATLVYLNGSTDYIECYGYFLVGQNTSATASNTYFQASLLKAG